MNIFLTGGSGMVGQSIRRMLPQIAPDCTIDAPDRGDLDLTDRVAVKKYLAGKDYDLVIHAAAKVGGIKANIAEPVEFLTQNLLMNLHVIEESRAVGIRKLIYFGSSCMYPRNHRNPLVEEDILAAPLEPTNEAYAIAKIAGQRLCAYISRQYGFSYKTLIPCNLYGPGDHFDSFRGHLVSAAILKVHEAVRGGHRDVEIWGDGTVRREFLYVDDLAEYVIRCSSYLEKLPDCLNIGSGLDYTVNEYYEAVAKVVGFKGRFVHNPDEPVGMDRKLMDSSKASELGWKVLTSLEEGLVKSYADFVKGCVSCESS